MAEDTEPPEEEEDEEDRRERERQKNAEYMQWRRDFDKFKRETEGVEAESDALKAQGNNFFSLGLYMQACTIYSEALELAPENPVLYCNRAMAYLKQEMPDEALADAERSLKLDATAKNIKAYWRKAQALLDLRRPEEAEAAASEGIALEASNSHLNKVRSKAREESALRDLCCGKWVNSETADGIQKGFSFDRDGIMTMYVFGHKVRASFELSVECSPRSMVIRMKPEGPLAGTGPPPPPVPYIFEFHEEGRELWMCHPVDSAELPTKFEGPGFDKMTLEKEAPESNDKDDTPLDVRCERYIREMNALLPMIPPQLPERPSEEEIGQEVLIMEKLSQMKRRHGMTVHQRSIELAKDPSQAGSTVLTELAWDLQRRLVTRKILPLPSAKPIAAKGPDVTGAAVVSPAVAAELPKATGHEAGQQPPQQNAKPPVQAGVTGCLGGLVARFCSSRSQ